MIKKLIKLKKEQDKLYNETGFIGFSGEDIHLSYKCFLSKFDSFEIKERDSTDYCYQLETYVGDIKFFCVLTEQEFITKVKEGLI